MKVKRIAAFLLSVSVIMFNGCTKTKVESKKPEDNIKGKITVWSDKEDLQVLKISIDNFKKLHSKADIQLQEVDNENVYLELKKALDSNTAVPDIVVVKDKNIQVLLKNYMKNFADVSSIIKKENYLKSAIDNATKDGKVLAIPLSCKPAVVLYRKDILASSKVNPEYIKTWNDLITYGQTIFQAQKINMLALPLSEESTYRMFLNQLGASYFDKTGNVTINSTQAVRAADMLKLLYTQGSIQNVASQANVMELLKQGKIAAAITDYVEARKLLKSNPELKDKLGIMKPPAFEEGGNQGINLGGSNMLLINSNADKTLASEFSKFMSQDRDNLKLLLNDGLMFPANTSYYEDIWFSKASGDFGGIKLWKLISQNAEDMYGINYTENFSVITSELKNSLENIVIKGGDSKALLDDLSNKLQTVKG